MFHFRIKTSYCIRASVLLVGLIALPSMYSSVFSANDTDVVTEAMTDNTANLAIDIHAGEQLYVQCVACHSPSYHRTGPKHCGIFGKVAGSDAEFTFTDAMKNSGITWNAKTLDEFLSNPFKVIPGTSMGFSGIKSAKDRQQLIAFLKSLNTDNEKCE